MYVLGKDGTMLQGDIMNIVSNLNLSNTVNEMAGNAIAEIGKFNKAILDEANEKIKANEEATRISLDEAVEKMVLAELKKQGLKVVSEEEFQEAQNSKFN